MGTDAPAPALGLLTAIAAAASEQMAEQRLRADLGFLTSDVLAGRLSLTPQADIAALYLAAEFQKAGLQPANGESYLQPFPLVAYRGDAKARRLAVARNGRTKQFPGSDFTGAFYREAHIHAPLVFAGYGITAPEHRYDDYAGLDVTGKVVLLFDHEPQEDDPRSIFAGTGQDAHWGRTTKMRNAQRHGAAAVLIASEPIRKHAGLMSATPRPPGATGQPLRASAPPQSLDDPTQIPVFSISDAAWPTCWPRLDARPRSCSGRSRQARAAVADAGRHRRFAGHGKRRGAARDLLNVDPGARRQRSGIAFRARDAHRAYDHLGLQNGRVYPGANDNASGTVAVLELARRFAQAGARPKRTLAFAVFGSEEELMLGSTTMFQHPLRPLDRTRAVLIWT